MSEAKTVVMGLRAAAMDTDTWRAYLTTASHVAIRHAIRECCLSATSVCCNRTRVGLLALELVDRAQRATIREQAALDRANKAEADLLKWQEAQPATVAMVQTLAKPAKKKGGK